MFKGITVQLHCISIFGRVRLALHKLLFIDLLLLLPQKLRKSLKMSSDHSDASVVLFHYSNRKDI